MIPGYVVNVVYENYQLSTEEIGQIRSQVSHIPSDVIKSFDYCYGSLHDSFSNSPYSDPNVIRDEKDYKALMKIFEMYPAAKYLLYMKVCEAETISVPILQDIVLPDNDDRLQRILSENKEHPTTPDGANIIYTNLSVATKLISGLLYKDLNKTIEGLHWNQSTLSDDESILNVMAAEKRVVVNISLADDAIVSLQLNSSMGNFESTALKKKGMAKGSYSFDMPVNQRGMYIVRLIVNGRLYSRKIMIE